MLVLMINWLHDFCRTAKLSWIGRGVNSRVTTYMHVIAGISEPFDNLPIWRNSASFLAFVCLILYVSVMSGQVILGWISTKQIVKCFAQEHNVVPPVRLEPAIPGSRVKHSTTTLLIYKRWISKVGSVWTPGAWLARFIEGTTRLCYIPNITGFREEDFLKFFPL